MLSYVFWHHPAPGPDESQYEARLIAFHRVLAGSPPVGFLRSATYRIQGAPWRPAAGGYEDWYELVDWTALGVLNAAAVSASMRAGHDAAAALAGGGAGGVYASVRAAARGRAKDAAAWLSKPRGTTYPEFARAGRAARRMRGVAAAAHPRSGSRVLRRRARGGDRRPQVAGRLRAAGGAAAARVLTHGTARSWRDS